MVQLRRRLSDEQVAFLLRAYAEGLMSRVERSAVWRGLARPAYRGPYGCSCEPAVRSRVGAGGLEPSTLRM